MQKIHLVCVGRIRERAFSEACREYEKRLTRFCRFKVTEAPEFTDADRARNLDREAPGILRALEGRVVLFDVRGKKLSSEGLSELVREAGDAGQTMTFVIGGSQGVAEEVRRRADLLLSVSDMTFPHMLFRVMAEEQIYRAFMIKSGAEYHK